MKNLIYSYTVVGGPWKSNATLEKSLKNGYNYLYEPWYFFDNSFMAIAW